MKESIQKCALHRETIVRIVYKINGRSVQKQCIYMLIFPQRNDVVMWQQEEELREVEIYREVKQLCIPIEAKIQVQLAIAGAIKM